MKSIFIVLSVVLSLLILSVGISAAPPAPTDSDNDGILDVDDLCMNTESGDVVNSDGCSVVQICSENLRNHGEYVSCVSHTSKYFLLQGLITKDERKNLITEAAKSDIGK